MVLIKFIHKFFGLRTLYDRIESLEKRIVELEYIKDERESLWLFIEDVRNQEIEAAKIIQEELENMIARSLTPMGDA